MQNDVFQLISTPTPCDRHMVLVCYPAAKVVHTGLLLITRKAPHTIQKTQKFALLRKNTTFVYKLIFKETFGIIKHSQKSVYELLDDYISELGTPEQQYKLFAKQGRCL